jgi:hypothetical protein
MAGRSSVYSRGGGSPLTRTRDHDLFDARRRSFANWRARFYPVGLGYGYPYVIDPGLYDSGFYDWGGSDNSAYDQGDAPAVYPPPYSDEGYSGPTQQASTAGPSFPSASSPAQPLTVIFKGGRDPVKVQNYMLTAKALTDLDSQRYEQIPLDEIDLAATQRVNSTAGVEFEIPSASRD